MAAILHKIVLDPQQILDDSVNMDKIDKLDCQAQAPSCFLHGGGVRKAGACFFDRCKQRHIVTWMPQRKFFWYQGRYYLTLSFS
jgi:hypothetical protein